jgi:hypothetical protein
MINETLVYIGSAVIIAWGVTHIVATGSMVKGFGDITEENRRILVMEIVTEGLALVFLGGLPLAFTILSGPLGKPADIVYLACAAMLLVMALLTLLTGTRTSQIPYKVCPVIKTAAAVLFILGSVL